MLGSGDAWIKPEDVNIAQLSKWQQNSKIIHSIIAVSGCVPFSFKQNAITPFKPLVYLSADDTVLESGSFDN